jgi:DNA replication protein DnaC
MLHTFENFKHLPGTDVAYRAFLALATQPLAQPFLICYGGVGNGKTYLAEALILKYWERGLFTRLYTYPQIVNTLKKAMDPGAKMSPPSVIIDRYINAQRLVIDDAGMVGSDTAYSWGVLEEIVVGRYRERRTTVLTTNLDAPDGNKFPSRIYSRFCDPDIGVVVLNNGGDYRRR